MWLYALLSASSEMAIPALPPPRVETIAVLRKLPEFKREVSVLGAMYLLAGECRNQINVKDVDRLRANANAWGGLVREAMLKLHEEGLQNPPAEEYLCRRGMAKLASRRPVRGWA